MNLAIRIDNNIVAIIVSFIFLINITETLDKQEIKNKAFLTLFKLNTLELVIETLTCILNKQPYTWLIPINTLLHSLLFLISPLIAYQWYTFANLWIKKDKKYGWQKNSLLLAPLILNTVLTILSPFMKFIFYVNRYNIYTRGWLFFVGAMISFFYLFAGFIIIYSNRNKLKRIEFLPLLLFGVFPSIAGLLQSLFYGILLIWSSVSFSLIILYIYIQQQMLHIDYLTGAWTREKLYNHLSSRIHHRKSKNFSIVFIDLDDFKKINDTFGHNEGDKALTHIVSIIRSVLNKEDSITRYGGDEFVLFLNADNQQDVEAAITKIHNVLSEYNNRPNALYELSFSYGYELYNFETHVNVEEFISQVDKLMYYNKSNKKAHRNL